MRFFYSFKKSNFIPLYGNNIEIRTYHQIFCGLIKWTSTKNVSSEITV